MNGDGRSRGLRPRERLPAGRQRLAFSALLGACYRDPVRYYCCCSVESIIGCCCSGRGRCAVRFDNCCWRRRRVNIMHGSCCFRSSGRHGPAGVVNFFRLLILRGKLSLVAQQQREAQQSGESECAAFDSTRHEAAFFFG